MEVLWNFVRTVIVTNARMKNVNQRLRLKSKIVIKMTLSNEKLKEIRELIDKIEKKLANDPDLPKKCEEFQKKYGTLTAKDLMRTFTI